MVSDTHTRRIHRHPPTVAHHHDTDTPAVTGGLHPLLDISPILTVSANSEDS